MKLNNLLIFIVISLFILVGCSKEVTEEEMQGPSSNLTCEQQCDQSGFNSSRCGSAAVVPEAEPICYENETDLGDTSDCTTWTNGEPLVGAVFSCCCN